MDLSFLSEAEGVMLEMEKARRNFETAKLNLDNAKRSCDELLSKADELGVPKAKLKKLIEDRIAMLFDSGLLDFLEAPREQNAVKKPRKPKRAKSESDEMPPVTLDEEPPKDE